MTYPTRYPHFHMQIWYGVRKRCAPKPRLVFVVEGVRRLCWAPRARDVPLRDWDLAKFNDCLGSVTVDLTKPLQKAFRTKRPVSLFKSSSDPGILHTSCWLCVG